VTTLVVFYPSAAAQWTVRALGFSIVATAIPNAQLIFMHPSLTTRKAADILQEHIDEFRHHRPIPVPSSELWRYKFRSPDIAQFLA
jgi:hypothetical protein